MQEDLQPQLIRVALAAAASEDALGTIGENPPPAGERERFRVLGGFLRAALVCNDPVGTITYLNARAAQLTGYQARELVGHPLALVLAVSSGTTADYLASQQAGDASPLSATARLAGGGEIPLYLFPFPRFDSQGDYIGSFASWIPATASAPPAQRQRAPALPLMYQRAQPLACKAPVPATVALSQRERQVLEQLLQRHDVRSIARQLAISPHTVKNHLKAIYRKLGVHSQLELFSHCLRRN